ncbi:hemolymph lipopolysaccharide-binding protein-like [Phymastichus coffea]|uniref:hemolymph lipopolysaccharide-binding protein-like n=1 Tax=Phymastichus coffea TaxID=108790 RepID=UPI00273B43D1|nr:hemolymph lipopolysaccharide-binding protein-like [Phymastichus coffea]
MYLLIFIVSSTISTLEITAATISPANALTINLCSANQTIVTHVFAENRGESGTSCTCQAVPSREPVVREDYVHTPGIGSHKIHTDAKNWNDARKICNDENAHLAIINSAAEEAILVDMLKKAEKKIKLGLNVEQALLGIHDLYKEGEWVTLFGESLLSTGFSKWNPTYWGGQPDNFENRQNCGAIINIGGMDDVDCRDKFAFFCEMPFLC